MVKDFNNKLLATYVKNRENAKAVMDKIIGNQRGAGAVEYGLVIAVVVIMMIAAAAAINPKVMEFFDKMIDKVIKQAGFK